MKLSFTHKKIRILLSSIALLFGGVVLSISLISTSQAKSYEGVLATSKKLYFNDKILPDHLLYPVVATADKILLSVSSESRKVELLFTYGQIRLDYAQGLLEKGDKKQALVALTKSQKYFHQAVSSSIELKSESDSIDFDSERDLLEYSIVQSELLIKQLDIQGKDFAIRLNDDNKVLLNRLK